MLDVASMRQWAEDSLVDECTITVDPQGRADDTLNADLTLTPPADDATVVYQGACFINADRFGIARERSEGGQDTYRSRYKIRVPMSVTGVVIGAVLTCTASQRDPRLVGETFLITDFHLTTVGVTRQLIATRRKRGPRD